MKRLRAPSSDKRVPIGLAILAAILALLALPSVAASASAGAGSLPGPMASIAALACRAGRPC